MGRDETVESIGLHVRGGDAAAGVVADIITHLGLRGLDCGTGDFFDPAAAADPLRAWCVFRDQAIGQAEKDQSSRLSTASVADL